MAQRVLVIDDEPVTRKMVAAFLEAAGYEVHAAERGESGLTLAAAAAPDLILVDLMLPDMDGYAVCQALRAGPATKQTPIVMITASDDLALNRKAYAAGAQACLLKPFRREALIAALHAAGASRPRESA